MQAATARYAAGCRCVAGPRYAEEARSFVVRRPSLMSIIRIVKIPLVYEKGSTWKLFGFGAGHLLCEFEL